MTASCSGWPGASRSARAWLVGLDVFEVEGDPVVSGGDRLVLAGPDVGGHVGDLVAAAFAFGDASTEAGERGFEGQFDVVGLQAAGAGLVHRGAQRLEVGLAEVVGGQGALLEQFRQSFGHGRVDDLVHPFPDLGVVAVADGLQEQVAQRGFVEGVAEDVKDFAAVGFALFFDLDEQPGVDVAFAGVAGDDVPQSADLFLADAVDAAEALLDAVGVPR